VAQGGFVPVLTPFVDIANARLTFDSGAVANITASRVSRERMRRFVSSAERLPLTRSRRGNGESIRMRGDLDLERSRPRRSRWSNSSSAFRSRLRRRAAPARVREPFWPQWRGEGPVAVTGGEGARYALSGPCKMSATSSGTLPALAGRSPLVPSALRFFSSPVSVRRSARR